MKRMGIKLQAVMLAVVITVGAVLDNGYSLVKAADSSQMSKVQIQVTYGQTEARSMLDGINTFRQGEEAWVWDENDTEKITYSNLGALSIDPVLEQSAMLRAVEIALVYSHTRPDGQSCFTAYSDTMRGYNAENIAIGYSSAEDVFRAWQETDQNFSGQGHRRNLLGSNYVTIGIGHVIYQGTHCWVQEFSSKRSGESLTDAKNSTAIEELEVLSENIQNIQLNKSAYSLTVGETASLEDLNVSAEIAGHWPSSRACLLENDCSFVVADDRIASVENGRLSAKSVGTTTLVVTVLGQEISIPITIAESSVNPTETSDPTGSGQPGGTGNPPDTAGTPAVSSQPGETGNPPDTAGTPSVSSQPGEIGNPPDTAGTPTVSSQPGETGNLPDTAGTPSVSSQPGGTQNPSATKAPSVTQDSAGNRLNPVVTKNPTGTVQTKNPLQGKKVTGIQAKQKKKSKKLTVRFQRLKKAEGYQITYAWNKKFTKHRKIKNTKSTSVVLSGLKHKKVYYIKVCAYTLDQNGRKRYSADSKIIKRKMK